MTTAVDNRLTATGVAVLLAYWEGITQPKGDHPGIECHQLDESVVVRAYGYATPQEAKHALDVAAEVCHDGGLQIVALGELAPHSGFVVRRRTSL